MSRAAKLRLGLVGCGRIAEHGYLPALSALDGAELAAVADPVPERTARATAAAGGPGRATEYRSAGELLAAERVDALVIASPPAQHVADAQAASAAGVPALVEKPPAADLEGAERIAGLRPAPWIGFNRRFLHAAALAAVVARETVSLELEIGYRRASWRAHTVRDDALLDLGPHLVDLALLVLGHEGMEILAAAVERERAEVVLATPRGRARIRCRTDASYAERCVALGPRGERLAASRRGGAVRNVLNRLPGVEHPLAASMRAQLTAFLAVARGERPPRMPASAEDGARVMRVLGLAREAAG